MLDDDFEIKHESHDDDWDIVYGEIIRTTEKAILIKIKWGYEHWVPRSLIQDGDSFNDFSNQDSFYVQRWFCEKEGL